MKRPSWASQSIERRVSPANLKPQITKRTLKTRPRSSTIATKPAYPGKTTDPNTLLARDRPRFERLKQQRQERGIFRAVRRSERRAVERDAPRHPWSGHRAVKPQEKFEENRGQRTPLRVPKQQHNRRFVPKFGISPLKRAWKHTRRPRFQRSKSNQRQELSRGKSQEKKQNEAETSFIN